MAADDETEDRTKDGARRRANGEQAPAADSSASAKRAPRRPPENAILAGRERHRSRPKVDPAAARSRESESGNLQGRTSGLRSLDRPRIRP